MSEERIPYLGRDGAAPSRRLDAINRICRLILEEVARRMEEVVYQNRSAAIHEVLMEIGRDMGMEMADDRR